MIRLVSFVTVQTFGFSTVFSIYDDTYSLWHCICNIQCPDWPGLLNQSINYIYSPWGQQGANRLFNLLSNAADISGHVPKCVHPITGSLMPHAH